jgi:hypothetical protein
MAAGRADTPTSNATSDLSESADTAMLRELAETPRPDGEGVAALLEIAEDTIEDERARGLALDSKTGSLVGFGGLLLSVNAAVAKPLFDMDLGSMTGVVRVSFAVAIASLLGAVLVAVLGVLRPQRYRGFGRDELRDFNTAEAQAMTRLVVHQRMLGAVADMLDTNRTVNDYKAMLTKWVGRLLALGFLAVALQAGVVGISQIGDADACVRRTTEITTGTQTRTITVTTCT